MAFVSTQYTFQPSTAMDFPSTRTVRPAQLPNASRSITDTLCGLSLRLSALSFYQVNTAQAERLYGIAKEFAKLTENLAPRQAPRPAAQPQPQAAPAASQAAPAGRPLGTPVKTS